MTLIEALRSSPGLLMACVTALGLVVGSFLNVLILRLPRMMEREWKRECRRILELPDRIEKDPLSLAFPASHCPSCGLRIAAWQNVPVFSWLWLRGRCAGCGTRISLQYPLVEAASGVLAALCVWRFGWSAQLAPALALTWVLLALAVIDLRTLLLPDDLTLPLLWAGLLAALLGIFVPLSQAVVGAMAGYLSLWLVYQAFRLVTGKEGMGYGDFKLLGALGAWLGWQALPLIILLSSLVGAVVGLSLVAFRQHDRQVPLPFGPYLAAAGWLALMWGDAITGSYLRAVSPG